MGKIYEALEWAEKEKYSRNSVSKFILLDDTRPLDGTCPIDNISGFEPDAPQFIDLKSNFLTHYSDGSIKSILFTGISYGDGSSTSAANFAGMLSKDSQSRVLLINANLRTLTTSHKIFRTDHDYDLQKIINSNAQTDYLVDIENVKLYVLPSGGKSSDPTALFQSSNFKQFITEMREKFDFIILDGPPLHLFPEGIFLSTKVDGVILVIHSGKTQRWIAVNAKKQIEEAGGNILGVVLNKRMHYIPDWIYKRI